MTAGGPCWGWFGSSPPGAVDVTGAPPTSSVRAALLQLVRTSCLGWNVRVYPHADRYIDGHPLTSTELLIDTPFLSEWVCVEAFRLSSTPGHSLCVVGHSQPLSSVFQCKLPPASLPCQNECPVYRCTSLWHNIDVGHFQRSQSHSYPSKHHKATRQKRARYR